MTQKEKLEALENLVASPGWEVLRQEMEASILQAAYHLAENPDMQPDAVNHRRGAIWAARKFLELPSQLQSVIRNDLLFEAAKAEGETTVSDPTDTSMPLKASTTQ